MISGNIDAEVVIRGNTAVFDGDKTSMSSVIT